MILYLDGESIERIAQNGKETLELKEQITAPGWKERIRATLHKGRFIKILTNRSNEGSTSNIGNENGDTRDGRKRNKNPPTAISVNESRRKKEDNMAVIFMGFIIVFLVCHLPRLLLNIHELFTIKDAIKCMMAGKNGFPLWSGVAIR